MLIPVIVTLCASCNKTSKVYIEPVNPNATQKAKNLYYFIQDIQGKYTLSGQHNFCGKGSEYSDQLEKLTGKKAIIWGSDFSFCVEGENAMRYQHCGPVNLPAFSMDAFRKRPDTTQSFRIPEPEFLNITLEEARNLMIEEIKNRYAQGHIITLMWHGCYPTEGDCCNGSSIWAMENRNDYKQSHHDDLAALAKGKPIALGQVGEIPSEKILDQQPKWSWYMPWGWILFMANKPDEIKDLINSEKVLTLDEINIDKRGRYSFNMK